MRTSNPRSFVLSVTIMILFVSTGWISSVSALQQQQTPLGVRITDPAKEQQLAIGKNLSIAGTSSYSSTSNCGVYVIVDGIKPYQKTIPIGQAGGNDYSKWKYTLTPASVGTIKEGINRITAKLVCEASPVNLTKFYSINVTGMTEIIPKQPSAIASNNTAAVPVSSNSMAYLYHLTPLINQLPAGHDHRISTSTSSSSSDSSGGSGHHHSVSDKNHGKSRTSKHHDLYEGGPGGSFNGGPGGSFNGGYDSDNPFEAPY
ncbi:MAG: hypothetical protein WA667_09065 [Candidatus Nitrosopolaris sp.]